MRRLQTIGFGLVLAAGMALGQTVSGTVWENTPDSGNAADPANMGSTLASASFTSSGIFYCSDTGVAGCPATSGYTVGAFLGNPTFTSPVNGFDPTVSADNMEVQLTGSIYLTAGANAFSIGHDDGLTLALSGGPGTTTCSTQSGSLCVNEPGPTGYADTGFSITASATGSYSFTLDYSECCGAPAYLLFAYPSGAPVGSTPEPASVVLFGTLLGGSTLVLRRRKKA